MGKIKTLDLNQLTEALDVAETNTITLNAIRERAEQMIAQYDSPAWHKNPYAFGGMLAYKAILNILNGENDE